MLLRRHFAWALRQQFPRSFSDSLAARLCLRSKTHVINEFLNIFTCMSGNEPQEETAAAQGTRYLKDVKDGAGTPYIGKDGWVLDEELGSEEEA